MTGLTSGTRRRALGKAGEQPCSRGGRVDYLNHVTLNTGPVRRSPRSEVSDEILVELAPALARARGRVKLPNFRGYFVSVDQDWTGGAAFTLSKRRLPLVRCAVATDTASAWQGRVWLVAQGRVAAQHVELPWLGVWLTPDMLDSLKVLGWLGDAQRSIALGDHRRCGPRWHRRMIHRGGHLRSRDSEFLFRRMGRVVTEGPVRGA